VIQQMTLDRLLQLLELRGAVERLLVVAATRRATLEERSRMLQLASAVKDAAGIDAALYLRVVRDINSVLCEAARNEFLGNVMASVYALSRQFAFANAHQPETRRRAAVRHAELLRAAASQDAAAAERAAANMMRYLRQYYAQPHGQQQRLAESPPPVPTASHGAVSSEAFLTLRNELADEARDEP
jgi:DNA-binding GntR family transcriptional regulator